MTDTTTQPARATDIAFHPLSAHEWRVSDHRFDRDSIDSLLGFVARLGDTYYATRIARPAEALPFASLDRVAEHFARQLD